MLGCDKSTAVKRSGDALEVLSAVPIVLHVLVSINWMRFDLIEMILLTSISAISFHRRRTVIRVISLIIHVLALIGMATHVVSGMSLFSDGILIIGVSAFIYCLVKHKRGSTEDYFFESFVALGLIVLSSLISN